MCVSVCAGVKGTFCHVLLVFGWARGSVRVYLSLDLYSLCLSLAVCRPYLCMSTHGSWFCACVSLPPLVPTPIIIYIANYFLQRTLLFTFLSLSVCTQCVNSHVHTRARKKREKKTFSWSQLDLSQPGLGTDLYIFAGHLSIVTPSCSSFKAPEQVRQQGLGFS